MLICKKPKIFEVDLIAVGLIIGIGAATWLFLIKPLNEKTIRLYDEQGKQKQTADSARQELDQLKGLTMQEQTLASRLRQTKNILPANPSVSGAVSTLESFCRQCGLRLDEIEPGETTQKPHFNKTSIAIRLTGSFPQLQQLLVRIKEEMQHVRISSMSVNIRKAQLGECEINFSMDVFSKG